VEHYNQSCMPLHSAKSCIYVCLMKVYPNVNFLKVHLEVHVNVEHKVRIAAGNFGFIIFSGKKGCACPCASTDFVYLYSSCRSRSDQNS
jgi:hypothetical protein